MNAHVQQASFHSPKHESDIMAHLKGWLLLTGIGLAALLVPLLGISSLVS